MLPRCVQVEWSAEPWGQWRIWARAGGYEALLEASCEDDAGQKRVDVLVCVHAGGSGIVHVSGLTSVSSMSHL